MTGKRAIHTASGKPLGAIGQGTGGGRVIARDAWAAILRLGFELGMNVVDTAEVYSQGDAEIAVGAAAATCRDDVFICSKVAPKHASRSGVRAACDASLRRLRTDYLDAYLLHWPAPDVPLEETIEAFRELAATGKVRFLGLSNFGAQDTRLAASALGDLFLFAENEYSLVSRQVEASLLPLAAERGFILMAYTPLKLPLGGRDRLRVLANESGASPQQLVLKWLLTRGPVLPIPMTLNRDHLRENAQAMRLDLDAGILAELTERFRPREELVLPSRICVLPDASQQVYTTLEEALANPLGLYPGPQDLADAFLAGTEPLKPVQLIESPAADSQAEFRLVQGRVRYWGWVIAYGFGKPIPAQILP